MMINDPTRRDVFTGLAAMLGLGAVGFPTAALAQDGSGLWDVSYVELNDLDAAFDVRGDIANLLGPGVASDLRVVRNSSGLFQVIYDRDGTSLDGAKKVAASHTQLLRKTDVFSSQDSAEAIRDQGYSSLHNVSYGVGSNLKALENDLLAVRRILGEGVGTDLVIEERSNDKFALVYQRRGTLAEAQKTASKHHSVLRRSSHFKSRKGVLATSTPENGYDLIAGETSVANDRAPIVNNIQPSIGQVTSDKRPEVSVLIDSDLERVIERQIKSDRANSRLYSSEATSWVVFNYTTGEMLVDINGDVPRQCASMVKPFVALAFFDRVKRGELAYGLISKGHMEASIQRSSNTSTNWLIDRVGGPGAVQKILSSRYSGIFHNTRVVEKIPKGGRTYKNKASARDYSRFLYALWNDNVPNSRELRRLMALPGRDRLYSGAPDVPTGTLVYNKTGSTGMCIADFGILSPKGIDGKRYPYHVVGIVERSSRSSNYGAFSARAGKVIRAVSNTTYNWLQQNRHPLK